MLRKRTFKECNFPDVVKGNKKAKVEDSDTNNKIVLTFEGQLVSPELIKEEQQSQEYENENGTILIDTMLQ